MVGRFVFRTLDSAVVVCDLVGSVSGRFAR